MDEEQLYEQGGNRARPGSITGSSSSTAKTTVVGEWKDRRSEVLRLKEIKESIGLGKGPDCLIDALVNGKKRGKKKRSSWAQGRYKYISFERW